jgi:DNA-binding phage protein
VTWTDRERPSRKVALTLPTSSGSSDSFTGTFRRLITAEFRDFAPVFAPFTPMGETMPTVWTRQQVYNKLYTRKRRLSPATASGAERETSDGTDTVETVLRALDEAREHAGLSKADLAQKAGLPEASIRKLFSSQTANPALKTLSKLAGALGLKITLAKRPG